LSTGKFLKKFIYYMVMVLLALFFSGPFIWLTFTSLKSGQDVFQLQSFKDIIPRDPTLKNFEDVWTAFDTGYGSENKILNFFKSTIIIVGIGLIMQIVLAALAGYPLARLKFPGKNLIAVLLFSTLLLPVQANMIVNFLTIRKLGIFDTYAAVILPGAVTVFGVFLMRQAYLVIPTELEDAARIDGCGEFQIWYRIMLPLTRPALGTLAIFSFVAFWNSFMWPLIILKSDQLYPISVGLAFLANTFDSNFKLVAAASVLSMIPVIIVFLLMQKQFIKGITEGAIK